MRFSVEKMAIGHSVPYVEWEYIIGSTDKGQSIVVVYHYKGVLQQGLYRSPHRTRVLKESQGPYSAVLGRMNGNRPHFSPISPVASTERGY